MGTGCGGGIVYKGEVFTGPQAIAGEWGHMSIDPQGRCAIAASAAAWRRSSAAAGWKTAMPRNLASEKPLKEIEKEYYAGEPRAVEFMQVFFRNFGRALANLIDILDPDMVVLGGGVSNFDAIYTEGVEQVRQFVFTDEMQTPIVKNQLGDSAGVLGAALVGI